MLRTSEAHNLSCSVDIIKFCLDCSPKLNYSSTLCKLLTVSLFQNCFYHMGKCPGEGIEVKGLGLRRRGANQHSRSFSYQCSSVSNQSTSWISAPLGALLTHECYRQKIFQTMRQLCEAKRGKKKKEKKELVLQRAESNKLIALVTPSSFETAPPKAKGRS